MNKLEIKPITSTDVAEVVTLDGISLGGLWQPEAYLREIDSDKSTLLALHLSSASELNTETKIIGMGCLWSIVDEAHITLLAVHPDYRRQGLGQLLLLELLKDAIARNLAWATLEVNENNLAAVNLYKKYGFQIAGKRKNYYQPAGDDALVLWLKNLQQNEFQSYLSQAAIELDNFLSNNNYGLK
ncbi:MAG: ribosomal protein S18-alanine N-acetyltransferase [Cyanobacteria bacterium J06600_6]